MVEIREHSQSSTSGQTQPAGNDCAAQNYPSRDGILRGQKLADAQGGTDAAKGGEIVVKAQVPLSELEGYAAELKSVTAGRGRYAMDFSHYEPVPPQVQQKLVDAYKPKHEED